MVVPLPATPAILILASPSSLSTFDRSSWSQPFHLLAWAAACASNENSPGSLTIASRYDGHGIAISRANDRFVFAWASLTAIISRFNAFCQSELFRAK